MKTLKVPLFAGIIFFVGIINLHPDKRNFHFQNTTDKTIIVDLKGSHYVELQPNSKKIIKEQNWAVWNIEVFQATDAETERYLFKTGENANGTSKCEVKNAPGKKKRKLFNKIYSLSKSTIKEDPYYKHHPFAESPDCFIFKKDNKVEFWSFGAGYDESKKTLRIFYSKN